MAAMPAVVLGSASPRRAELLAQLGIEFTQRSADIDESPRAGERPRDYVQRMAREKAAALSDGAGDALLLTADTTVVLDGQSLGKPATAAEARRMLTALSGSMHEVLTAVCLRQARRSEELLVVTQVEFAALEDALIDAYLRTDEPWDKAGAYAIQGLGGSFVRSVVGSVSNVIGLPLVETRELFARFKVAVAVRQAGA